LRLALLPPTSPRAYGASAGRGTAPPVLFIVWHLLPRPSETEGVGPTWFLFEYLPSARCVGAGGGSGGSGSGGSGSGSEGGSGVSCVFRCNLDVPFRTRAHLVTTHGTPGASAGGSGGGEDPDDGGGSESDGDDDEPSDQQSKVSR